MLLKKKTLFWNELLHVHLLSGCAINLIISYRNESESCSKYTKYFFKYTPF